MRLRCILEPYRGLSPEQDVRSPPFLVHVHGRNRAGASDADDTGSDRPGRCARLQPREDLVQQVRDLLQGRRVTTTLVVEQVRDRAEKVAEQVARTLLGRD